MPIYEYQCRSCGKLHEIMQRYTDAPLTHCPDCGGELKKLISNTSFILKGTGWYKTDYAGSSTGKTGTSEKTPGTAPEKKAEDKPGKKAETASGTK